MKRILSLVSAAVLVVVALVFALQQPPSSHPLLDRAKKATGAKSPVAILLEFGHKDEVGQDWSGQAAIIGAKVVHREGYRFRAKDKLVDPNGWQASTRPPIRAPKGQPAISKLLPIATVGVVLHLQDVQPGAKAEVSLKNGEKVTVALADVLTGKTQALWDGKAVARLVTTASPVANTSAEEDFPAAAYGPDGTLWVAYISYKNRDEKRRIEAPQLKEMPQDFKAYAQPKFADDLYVRSLKNGKWSEPIQIAGLSDIVRCAINVNAKGNVNIHYSTHYEAMHQIAERTIEAGGKIENIVTVLTDDNGPPRNLSPVSTTDAQGRQWLAFQSRDQSGQASIIVHYPQGAKRLKGEPAENCWHPAIAASPTGQVAVAYDIYHNGSYDIRVCLFDSKAREPRVITVAGSAKFEARPSLVYDAAGRLWIAYEEGAEKWGKDYGTLAPGRGEPLYGARSVRVVCLDTDGKLQKPAAELPTSIVVPPVRAGDPVKTNLFERGSRYAYPQIGIDGRGQVWLTYRRNFGSRYSSNAGAYWLTFARRLEGQSWSEEIEVHHSDGLLDSRPVLLPHRDGGLLIVHNTDGRYTTPETIDNQVYASVVNLPARAAAVQLVPHEPGETKATPEVAAENESAHRLKQHRVKANGKTYQLLRGEYHRHTEISWDGGADGSLEDMFRYAIDAAQMDWIGNGDHDNGAGREYSWWLTQKFSDAYFQPKAFTTMFTYERSVAYPHGHRNVMFAQRGIMTLPRLAAPPDLAKPPGGVHPDDTKMLYRYLHQFGGICASHTSATGMGTDWRDGDPIVEPIVEIYQGDRMSYEKEGAPRAGYDPQSGKEPANVAGWYPKGYINLALQKGYKLGFQSSSDHWSTHISFFIVLSEGRERKQLLDAVKRRHCYAATDFIVVDFRSGEHVMGDVITAASQAPKFQIHVVGAGKLDRIDILRDSDVVDSIKGTGTEFKGEWTDRQPMQKNHYYYVRVVQANGELAWASPIWVELKTP